MSRSTPKTLLALAVSLALAGSIAACGDDEGDGGGTGGGGAPSGELKTGPGVTADTIRLGVLTDSSGVFAGLGIPLTDGNRAFWRQQNAAGGVCDRRVTLDVKDHGYDPQKAAGLYSQIEGDVLALNQLLGSAVTAAVLPNLQRDKLLSVLAGWPSQLAANPNVIVVGATYDVEAINGIDFLVEEKGIKQGDKLGVVYFEGEYGENFLTGAQHVAEKQGLELVEQKIKATDTDMSGPVAALKRQNVAAIALAAGPRQTASLAGVAAASGLNVPIIASGPGFDPALLKTPAAKALEANVSVVAATSPYDADAPGVSEARAGYEKAYPKGRKPYSVMAGWAESQVMYAILSKACENKDLTRDGLQTAVRQLNNVDLQGVVAGTLDYSNLGQPPSKSVYINKVDPKAAGGLVTVGGPRVSANAEAYQVEGG